MDDGKESDTEREENDDLPPKKKKSKTSKETRLCFLCKKKNKSSDSYKTYTYNPSLISLENLLTKIKARHEIYVLTDLSNLRNQL